MTETEFNEKLFRARVRSSGVSDSSRLIAELEEGREPQAQMYRLELDTRLETAFTAFSLMCFILALFAFFGLLQGRHVLGIALLLVLLGLFFLLLRYLTDNFFIIDIQNRLIVYRFRFLFFEKYKPVGAFEDILAIGVTISVFPAIAGIPDLEKEGLPDRTPPPRCDYYLVLITKDGRQFRISDMDMEGYDKYVETGSKLAAFMGVNFLTGNYNQELIVEKNKQTGKIEVYYRKFKPRLDILTIFSIVTFLLGFCLLFLIP